MVKNRKFRILFGGVSVLTDIPLCNARFFLYIEYMFGIMDLLRTKLKTMQNVVLK